MPCHVVANSGLIAIALVIRARDGPRFVFHYPPHPSTKPSKRLARFGTELDDGEEEGEDEDGAGDEDDLDDGGYQIHHPRGPEFGRLSANLNEERGHPGSSLRSSGGGGGHAAVERERERDRERERSGRKSQSTESFEDDHFNSPTGEHIVPWEHVGEFLTTDLESILTPSRAYHKRKFELSLETLTFVSYPMHIREDGGWKKRKGRKRRERKESAGSLGHEGDEGGEESPRKERGVDDLMKGETNAEGDDNGEEHGEMTMFNAVFIFNLPKDEEDERIQEVYEHVIKKFNKTLRFAQASDDFVWKESEMILAMKEKAREDRRPMSWLWHQIMAKSTLATSVAEVYKAISCNKIATITLATSPPIDDSFQIPLPTFLTSIPSPTSLAFPGLLLTTANPMLDEDRTLDPSHLNKHFALLLLDDEDKIINSIQSSATELAPALLECIHICKPTLSFAQVSQLHNVALPELLFLVQHLILWRRAIAIPPLHARETYIVSPNCDSHQLPHAAIAWKRAFPLAIPLPNFLSNLSAAPRAYKTFFPSKNHRETYLDMLGWLIRGGWVTQLRTFAWICVWPEIIYEVEHQLKKEALEKALLPDSTPSNSTTEESSASGSEKMDGEAEKSKEKEKEKDPRAPLTTEATAEAARLARLAMKAATDAASSASTFSTLPPPVATAHPSINALPHLPPAFYLITDPHKVSHEESLYIKAIGNRFEEAKAKECWFRFCKYFNGDRALEEVALMEGMRRKEVWGVLGGFGEWLMVVRHW